MRELKLSRSYKDKNNNNDNIISKALLKTWIKRQIMTDIIISDFIVQLQRL